MFEISKKTLMRIFWCVCGCIVLYWLLHETERVKSAIDTFTGVFAPFIFGSVLAFVLNVPMRGLENSVLKKMTNPKAKRIVAIVLTMIALLLVISLVFWLLIPQITHTVNSLIPALTTFANNVQNGITDFLNDNPNILVWLKENTDFESVNFANLFKDAATKFGGFATVFLSGAIAAIAGIFSGVFDAVIALVFCVYALSQKETLARQGRKLLYAFVRERYADHIIRILRLTNVTFSNFFSGQCVEVCILGSIFAISMAIFGMPFIPLICVVIAVTAFIPIVGAWIGCALGAFLIFVQDPALAFWFVVMFLILQQLENSLIYPRVVGTSVGLPGMWVLLAVSLGGELMGVLGMFLMIPIASVLYALIREFTQKKLDSIKIDGEKLKIQPPELRSRFKEKREKSKQKRALKKSNSKQNKEEK